MLSSHEVDQAPKVIAMALLGIVSHDSTKMGGGLIKNEDAAPVGSGITTTVAIPIHPSLRQSFMT
jgi:hypothetical protein